MAHRYVYRKINNEEITWLEGTSPLDLRNAGKSILRFDLDGVTLVIKIPSQQRVFENPSRQMVWVWWYEIHLRMLSRWCYAGNGKVYNDEMVSLQWSALHLKTLSRYYYYVNRKSTTARWDHFGDLKLFLRCYWDAITPLIENLSTKFIFASFICPYMV